MRDEFSVTRQMAVRLCDAVLKNELPAEALATIGFCLIASDKFTFDGDDDPILADVIADWSCPEVNYALTLENVERFRKWLLGMEPYPEKPPLRESNGRVVSVTEKRRPKPWWRRFNQD